MIFSLVASTGVISFAEEADILDYLTYEIADEAVTITDCKTTVSGDVVIPDTIEGYAVTKIGWRAFYSCTKLSSITIPSGVTSISNRAFENCPNINSFTVDENNQYYSNDEYGVLFNKEKTELIQYPAGNSRTEYTVPSGVTKIDSMGFTYSDSLTSVTLSSGVTTIDSSVFGYCTSLESVTIPDSVKTISFGAFKDCKSLAGITIPESKSSIASDAFIGCISLVSFTVDENNKKYSNDENGILFNKAKTELVRYPEGISNTEYTVPENVTSIAAYAFYNCDSLTSVTIPDSVTKISSDAFRYCDKLENITILNPDCSIYDYESVIPDGATIYGYAGSTAQTYAEKYSRNFVLLDENGDVSILNYLTYEIGDEGVTITDCDESLSGSIVIPDDIEEYPVVAIGDEAFSGCAALTDVVLPDTVKTIGNNAFSGCEALKKVIASGAETVGDKAFYGCTSLDTFITFADILTVSDTAFDGCENLIVFVKNTAKMSAPGTLNVITFSLADSTLRFSGKYKSDLYYLFDLVAVMCTYYDDVQYLFFDSFEAVSADEGHIYYYTESWERKKFDSTKATNVKFSVEAFDSTGEMRHHSFNELCTAAADNEISNFYLIIEEADGLDKGDIELSLVDQIRHGFERIFKALVNLLNKLFAFFRR